MLNLGSLGQVLWQRGPVLANLPDNFSAKTVTNEIFGLGMVPKEVLSRLFNLYNLKILDLHLETWLWSPLIWTEKTLHRGSGYTGLRKNIYFQQFYLFWTFSCFFNYYYHIVIFIILYPIISIIIITLLNITMIFIIIIYYFHFYLFGYFIGTLVYFIHYFIIIIISVTIVIIILS